MKTTKSAEIKTRCTPELNERMSLFLQLLPVILKPASITVIHHQMLHLFHLW